MCITGYRAAGCLGNRDACRVSEILRPYTVFGCTVHIAGDTNCGHPKSTIGCGNSVIRAKNRPARLADGQVCCETVVGNIDTITDCPNRRA
ncbi:hypothetical protein D3C80_1344730 [compost metagenome]